MNYQRNQQVLIIFFFILTNLLATLRCQYYSDPSPTPDTNCVNTTYRTNVRTLLNSLPPNLDDNGFYNTSIGDDPDRANGMAICRGDTQLNGCRSCVQTVVRGILQEDPCLNNRTAIRWSDLCWVRYTDIPMFGIMDDGYRARKWDNSQTVNGATQFTSDLNILLDQITQRASRGGSLRKVAAGNRSTADPQTIYGMVQCTPDLSQHDCTSCLNTAVQQLSRDVQCCRGKGSVTVFVNSCFLRYSTRPFYDETRLLELEPRTMPPAPMPSTTSPPAPMPSTNLTRSALPSGVEPVGRNVTATSRQRIVTIVAVTVLGLMIIALIVAAIFIRRRKLIKLLSHHALIKPHGEEVQGIRTIEKNPRPPTGNTDRLHLKFDEIRVATNDFSKELGKGGFGSVFWGELADGRKIAVKRYAISTNQGEREFRAEVDILAQLKHKNLVTLIGFSCEGEEKVLVYEYVQNGSLTKFLFDANRRSNLDWNARYNIIGGIVKGLIYLHEDCQLQIVHRDLKPCNVLLDEKMDAKIADFGLARIIELDETHRITSKVIGTHGYIAPEYQMENKYSVKSDVFSFGVILLEIISGQRNGRHGHLISRAQNAWTTRTTESLVDPMLKGDSSIFASILRCIHIGVLCIQPKAKDRPTINEIVNMLYSPSMTLPEPSEEFHSVESE